jgi:hypothetical protein
MFNMFIENDTFTFKVPTYSNAYNFLIGNSNPAVNPVSAVYIGGDGLVGIGTDSPNYFCHIAGDGGTDTHMYVSCNLYVSGTIFGNLPAVETNGVLTVNNDAYLNGNVYIQNGLFCSTSTDIVGDLTVAGNTFLSSNVVFNGQTFANSNLTVNQILEVNGTMGIQIGKSNPLGPLQIGFSNGIKIVLEQENSLPSTQIRVDDQHIMELASSTGANPNIVGGFRFMTSSPQGYVTQMYVDTSNVMLHGTLQAMSNSTFTNNAAFAASVTIGDSIAISNNASATNITANFVKTNLLDVDTIGPINNVMTTHLTTNDATVNTNLSVGGPSTLHNGCTINITDPGIHDSSNALIVNGSMSAHHYYVSSDARIKKNVKPTSAAAAKQIIESLVPSQYLIKTTMGKLQESWGLIGQDVEALHPQLVNRSSKRIPDGRALSYKDMGTYACEDISALEVGSELFVRSPTSNSITYMATVRQLQEADNTLFLDMTPHLPPDLITSDLVIDARTVQDFVSVDYIQLISVLTRCVQDLYSKLNA